MRLLLLLLLPCLSLLLQLQLVSVFLGFRKDPFRPPRHHPNRLGVRSMATQEREDHDDPNQEAQNTNKGINDFGPR